MVDVVADQVLPVRKDLDQIYRLNQSEHYHNKCDMVDSSVSVCVLKFREF
jgi:hypothetical protein